MYYGASWRFCWELFTGPGPSVPSTRDLAVCCLVRRGALWLLIRTEVLASGLLHAHHLVLHAHYAVHWRRQSLGFDELCLSQSGYLPIYISCCERDIFQYSQFSITNTNGYFTHHSFKAVSLIRHIVTKHTVASRLLIKCHWTILSGLRHYCEIHSKHTCLNILFCCTCFDCHRMNTVVKPK